MIVNQWISVCMRYELDLYAQYQHRLNKFLKKISRKYITKLTKVCMKSVTFSLLNKGMIFLDSVLFFVIKNLNDFFSRTTLMKFLGALFQFSFLVFKRDILLLVLSFVVMSYIGVYFVFFASV